MKNPALSADLGNPYTARVLEHDSAWLLKRAVHQARSTMRMKRHRMPGYGAFKYRVARNPEMAKALGVSFPAPKTSRTDLWNFRNIGFEESKE